MKEDIVIRSLEKLYDKILIPKVNKYLKGGIVLSDIHVSEYRKSPHMSNLYVDLYYNGDEWPKEERFFFNNSHRGAICDLIMITTEYILTEHIRIHVSFYYNHKFFIENTWNSRGFRVDSSTAIEYLINNPLNLN